MLQPLENLQQRGLVKDCTDLSNLHIVFNTPNSAKLYVGFDLTAPSLHIGHLVLLMTVRSLLRSGCQVIILLGGGTTKIGDPWGKNKMRPLLDEATISANKYQIIYSILKILTPEVELQSSHITDDVIIWQSPSDNLVIMDNDFWLKKLNYIEFLRTFGIFVSVNRMLNTDLVRSRIANNLPLSFLELNYMLLQAYDFFYLHKHHQCNIQIGGSDQWNNILQGVDLIKRFSKEQDKVFGLTVPLITRSDGVKMGKTENGAIWLHPDNTSPVEYFQYFRNVNDEDVENYLKIFTELPIAEIANYLSGDINQAKITLALEATSICHGKVAAEDAMQAAQTIFVHGGIDQKNIIPYQGKCLDLMDIMIDLKIASSRGQAKKLIMNGGVKINGLVVKFTNMTTNDDAHDTIYIDEYLDNEVLSACSKLCKEQFKNLPTGICQLSFGKKRHFTIRI